MASIAFHDPRISSVSGGGETITLQLASFLIDAGHDVTIVTRRRPHSPLFRQALLDGPGPRIVEIETDIGGVDSLPTAALDARRYWTCDRLAPESLLFGLATRHVYGSARFDLVVVSFVLDLALLRANAPILMNVFGLPPDQHTADVERPLLERARSCTFASRFTRDEFLRLFRLDGARVPGPVVHSTIHSAFFAAHARGARKDFDVAFAGRLLARKGLHVVLDAMAWLAQRAGRRVTLAVAGDGPERNALEERARMLNLVDQITWLGPVDVLGVAGLLDRARLFVYPTLSPEPFGCSNLEAMARGTPVITTNLGGTVDYVCPEENALVCAPDSAESLACAIDRLLDDPQLSARLQAAGIATARRFHPQEGWVQWRRAFDEVLRRRG